MFTYKLYSSISLVVTFKQVIQPYWVFTHRKLTLAPYLPKCPRNVAIYSCLFSKLATTWSTWEQQQLGCTLEEYRQNKINVITVGTVLINNH